MPLLWRYLISHYLKVFALCTASFVGLLITLRLSEIAYFATLGPDAFTVLLFAFQQIIYILPIAIPISALISAVLLVQSLSKSKELTAMRSCGFSLLEILAPVLAAALFLSSLNFYIISELATTSHYASGQLKNQLRAVNPLLLLNKGLLMRMRGLYFDTYGDSRLGEFAQDAIFLSPNSHSARLSLMVAKRLDVTPELLAGSHVTLIASRQPKTPSNRTGQEELMIENMLLSETRLEDFSQLLEKKIWTINNDHLSMRLLLVRKQETQDILKGLAESGGPKDALKEARNTHARVLTEIMRRFSASVAVFSFTLMGLAFGINISRSRPTRGLFWVIFFASLYLVAFFTAKSFDEALKAAALLYFLPHALMISAAFFSLRKTARGIE